MQICLGEQQVQARLMHSFLFTDIESSTRLWEEHPTSMPDALGRHDRALGTAIARSRGRVVKTTGDGMIAVFDDVADAVQAALAGQSALNAESWSATGPLRARMAIHVGEAESRDNDFFGPTMNRAARIMAAGHGGQVLLSEAATMALEGRLPSGVTLVDLGKHRLKDLTLHEHLYQAVEETHPTSFPTLRTLDSRPHNLPMQTTEFLGRDEERAAIKAMLESPGARLLTLAGPGGIGKTRLSLQVAAEQLDNYSDGVFFVDLSAEREPSAAFEAVIRALNLPVSGAGDALQVLEMRLRDRNMLLVLDNLEQVTSIGPGLGELLEHAPDLDILVTSRETLRIRAERVFPIPPLGLPRPDDDVAVIASVEAVQLFAERARAVRPEFAITDENAAAVAEICLRLDGLPLAIELAAARLKIFTPSDLLERLRGRLDVLGAGGRDLPDRQRTLWGAIGWSYELLDEDERHVLGLTSVFSSASLRALEEVAYESLAMTDDLVDVLSSLVDKSLLRTVVHGSSQRFSMLLMIKEYAAERLAGTPDLEQSVRLAHARHYSKLVGGLRDRLHGPDSHTTIEELADEIGNMRTAWRYWVENRDLDRLFELLDGLWSLHESKGWYHAAIELLTDLIDLVGVAPNREDLAGEELALRTSLARAMMAVHGFGAEVQAAFEPVLALSQTVGSSAQRFGVLRSLASYYINVSDFTKVAEVGRELFDLANAESSQSIRAEANYVYGAAIALAGDHATGLPYIEEAIATYDPAMHTSNRLRLGPNTAVVARVASGLIHFQVGALDLGIARVTDALRVAREIDHPYSLAYAHYHNGYLAFLRRRFEECRHHAHELAVVSDGNDYIVWRVLATVLDGAGSTGLGDTEAGLEMTEAGVTLYRGLTTPPVFWPLLLALRAQVHVMAGRNEVALELIDSAIEIMGGDATPEFALMRGDILRAIGDDEGALAAYESAADVASLLEVRLHQLQAMTGLVQIHRERGDDRDRTQDLESAYATFTEGFDEWPLLEARRVLGESASRHVP